MIRRPPIPALFPYATLFRSLVLNMQYNPVVDRRYAPSSRRDDPEWFMLPSTLALAAFRAIEEDHDAEVHDRHQRLVIHRVPTMARRAALRFRLLHAPRPRRGHGRLGRDAGSRTPATLGARVSARRPDVDRVHARPQGPAA